MSELTLDSENARAEMDRVVERLRAEQPRDLGAGRGIVICGGGDKYFTCAWVCINMLRRLGCDLPIELWHLGEREMHPVMRRLVAPLGVICVDALGMRARNPVRTLNGWELKPFALLHSEFREILYLDADNVPIVEPSFLFDTPEFKQFGAIFWPDFGRLGPDRAIWSLTGVPYVNEPEFESGQILIDKSRCWFALSLAMWMNEFSDFWYRHVHGDKETFHMAWRRMDQPYAMPKCGIRALAGTMCQHDFTGRRLFQHRNMRKWTLGTNMPVVGFEFEHVCLQFLDELRPHHRVLLGYPPFDPIASRDLAGTTVAYHRLGHDQRTLELVADGTIGKGGDRMERLWGIRQEHHLTLLEIFGDDGNTARLMRDRSDSNLWRGYWLIHERMPVEIRPVSSKSDNAILTPTAQTVRTD